jgi:hypothetical protein
MFLFASRLDFVLVVAALCLSGRAYAQAAPVTYFIPGWPMGFGGDPTDGQSADTYGNFPSFDGSDARNGFSYTRYNFPNGWFVGGAGGNLGLSTNGINQYGAFGNSLYYQGVQLGYKFQNSVTIHAGFDTLKYNPGIGAPFGAFDTTSGYGAECQPVARIRLHPTTVGAHRQRHQFVVAARRYSVRLQQRSPLTRTRWPQ